MSLTKASYSMITGAYVNVLDYGATGDGTTNDTAAIQAAFNAADSTALKTVFFPAGTYVVNSTIIVNPNTTNDVVPQVLGEGSQATIIKAGASLGANAIFKHQGGSPSTNSKWTGFQLLGTGAANGQYGIYHINTCFVNYDDIVFNALAEGVHFENVGGGFAEQNVLTNCWAISCLYFITFTRASGSSSDSFRGTGFASECHMDLTLVANSRLVRIYYANALSPNCYNMPIHATVWCNATSAVIQNDSTLPFRALIDLRYESTANGWVMSTGNGATFNFFTGTMIGLAYNPTFNNSTFTGLINQAITIGNYSGSSGAFTPNIAPGTGSSAITYAANGQQGFYQVIGNICQLSIFLNITTIGAGGSGTIQITSLPKFSATNPGGIQLDFLNVSASNLTFTGIPCAQVQSGGNTYAVLKKTTTGTTLTDMAWGDLASSNVTLWITGSYFIS